MKLDCPYKDVDGYSTPESPPDQAADLLVQHIVENHYDVLDDTKAWMRSKGIPVPDQLPLPS